jgi:hypothetical protein
MPLSSFIPAFMSTSFAASVPGVTVRALLVCLLSFGALVLISRSRPEGSNARKAIRVSTEKTSLYKKPERDQRLTSLASLSIGAIVAGALVAIAVSVAIAYIVGTVTSLLQ